MILQVIKMDANFQRIIDHLYEGRQSDKHDNCATFTG